MNAIPYSPCFNKASTAIAACFAFFVSSVEASLITSPMFFGQSGDVTINFESVPGIQGITPNPTVLTNQYAGLGVSFRSEDVPGALQTTDPGDTAGRFEDPVWIQAAASGGGAPTSGVRYATGFNYPTSLNISDMRIDFIASVEAFGFYLIDNDFSNARISAFDASGTLIELLIVPEVGEGGFGYHGIAVPGISYAIIDGAGGGALDSTFIDDLSFRPGAAVPEPSSFLLLAVGLLLLGSLHRRWGLAGSAPSNPSGCPEKQPAINSQAYPSD